jgi:hypothetical protein
MKNKRKIYSFFKIYDKCKHEKLKFKYHILFAQFAKIVLFAHFKLFRSKILQTHNDAILSSKAIF